MKKWNGLLAFTMLSSIASAGEFKSLDEFGDNPGQLTASYYQPEQPSDNLVVLLHGCGQNGEAFAKQSGFVDQAKSKHFSLLIPQQHKSNNATVCFNWFSQADQDKDKGETLSIVNMIKSTKKKVKANKVFIAGLSAGGAMTSSLMIHYPELFTAGSVISGIPYPCADNLIKAISCMKSGSDLPAKQLAKAVHTENTDWPELTVISGTEDTIVNSKNSEQMALQWGYLTGEVESTPMAIDDVQSLKYGDKSELVLIPNLGHGMPVNPNVNGGGTEAPFILKSPISAAVYLANKWVK